MLKGEAHFRTISLQDHMIFSSRRGYSTHAPSPSWLSSAAESYHCWVISLLSHLATLSFPSPVLTFYYHFSPIRVEFYSGRNEGSWIYSQWHHFHDLRLNVSFSPQFYLYSVSLDSLLASCPVWHLLLTPGKSQFSVITLVLFLLPLSSWVLWVFSVG